MNKKTLIALMFTFSFALYAKGTLNKQKSNEASEVVDFKNIQQILKNDRLGSEVEKKKIVRAKSKVRKMRAKVDKYNIPRKHEFWSFFSEYWIVKNTTVLKWDFKKPDYGIESSFKLLLEKLGFLEQRFKVLLLNTPDIAHFALPSNDGEIIFLLSVPFVRTLDLSKLEISLLLFEDYLRLKADYFKNYVLTKKTASYLGNNFFEKKFDKIFLKNLSEKYDQMIYSKGYNFQQQFQITKQMSSLLKPEIKLWNAYYKMLIKKDNLVKSNILYQKYLKIYPSPELQLNWLKPKKKVL